MRSLTSYLRHWQRYCVLVNVFFLLIIAVRPLIFNQEQFRGTSSNSHSNSNRNPNLKFWSEQNITSNCDSCYTADARNLLKLLPNATGSSRDSPKSELSTSETTLKMARLFFLMKHNATGILHTSDLSRVKKSVDRLIPDAQPYGVSGLEYIGEGPTSDSSHYLFYSGIDYNKTCRYRIRYRMKALWTVGVRCRVVKDIKNKKHPHVHIDSNSPPIFSSTPKFSIENFSDSFFVYEGFWAMFSTLFSSGKDSRVWSLWAQRMLQETDGELAITPLACPPNRPTPQVEIEPDIVSKKVFDFIIKWRCEKENSFFACSSRLASDLLQSGYVKSDDVILHDLWINGLKTLGYTEPVRVAKTTKKEDVNAYCVLHSPALIKSTSGTPKKEKLFPNLSKPCKSVAQPHKAIDPFVEYVIKKPPKTADIAIVIIFCCSKYYSSNVPLLYDMYYNYFPTIIFCGPDYHQFSSFQQNFRRPVSFIEVRDTRAFHAQECITRAITLNFDVRGYFQMSDDNLLNAWNIGDLPREKFWFQKESLIANRNAKHLTQALNTAPWSWWHNHGGKYGKIGIEKTWNKMDVIKRENNSKAKEIVASFHETLHMNLGNRVDIYYATSDLFYVPSRFRRQWVFLAELFNANDVFLEIAVPTLIYGMEKYDNVLKLDGKYLWLQQRIGYIDFYNSTHHFMHPLKLSYLVKEKDARFLCYRFLGQIVQDRTSVV